MQIIGILIIGNIFLVSSFSTMASNNSNNNNSDRKLPPPPREGVSFNTLPWNLNLPEEHHYIHLTTTPEKGWTIEHYNPATDSGTLMDSHNHYHSTPLPLYPSTTSLNYGTTASIHSYYNAHYCNILTSTFSHLIIYNPYIAYK